MTEREKMIEIALDTEITGIKLRNITGGISTANAIADALIGAGYGDKEDWREYYKQAHDVAQRAFRVWDETFVKLWEAETQREEAEHRAEVAEKERDEWKERAERMHKEALKYKQRVSDSKHSEDTMRNQIECAMGMVSEMEHAKRTLEILYMSGAITEEALRDAVKQAKLEIEEEEADDH